MGTLVKSNLQLAASAAAALAAVVALSHLASIPGLGSTPDPSGTSAPLRSSVTGSSAASGIDPSVPPAGAGHVPTFRPHAVAPGTRSSVSQPVDDLVPAPQVLATEPPAFDPDHAIAMNDPANNTLPKAGALATGKNPGLTTSGTDLSATGPAGVALSDTFTLASRPSSKHTIFLDPRGGTYTDRAWNNYPASSLRASTLTFQAFTYGDTDPAFDADDLAQLQTIYLEVAADYAAFDVNVTLAPTTDAQISRSSDTDDVYGTQALLTSSTSTGKGGIAWLGATTHATTDNPMYWQPALIFGGSGGGSGHMTAQAASHEVGHTLGLTHEGASSEYYPGTTTWGPIMGTSYSAAMGQWSKGEFASARLNGMVDGKKVHQDEIGIIASTLGYADSDNATDASATSLSEGSSEDGSILSDADSDTYTYTGQGGVLIRATPTASPTNLDLALDVVDTTDNVAVADGMNPSLTISTAGYSHPTGGLDTSFYLPETTTDHTYRIVVSGGGNGSAPNTNGISYSSYGAQGDYTIEATATDAPGGADSDDGSFVLGDINALTRTPGVPMTLQVDYAQGDVPAAGTLWAWTSNNTSCRFSDPTVATPTLTCPATAKGSVTVTALVKPSGAPAQSKKATFQLRTTAQPAPHLTLAVAGQSDAAVDLCTGNAATILGTVTDQYGRPVYGANARIFTGLKATVVRSDINGHVNARTAAVPAASYAIDTLATGVYAAQDTKVEQSVTATPAPCFTADDTTLTLGDDVVAIPGVATPITATVATDDAPVTGVPVTFSVVYTDAVTHQEVTRTLGTGTTDAAGVASYSLKAVPTLPGGVLKATIAKSAIVPAAIVDSSGHLSVLSDPSLAFDDESFNINGVTAFTTDGFHEDELITNLATSIAGRLVADYDGTPTMPVGIPVTAAITYADSAGKTVVKRIGATTDARGWFRIAVKNPVPVGATGTVTVETARTTYYPAVAAIPFEDSTGTQAAIQVKPAALTIVADPGSVPAGVAYITFRVTTANPWPDASTRTGVVAPSAVRFTVAHAGTVYPTFTTKNGLFVAGLNGLTAGTWTITPGASTAYTGVPTSLTVS
ncbi:MAG: M12 family metallo-peptidase [Nocardioides sp.]